MSPFNHVEFSKFANETHMSLVEPLTYILHQAYAPLAEKGMRYLATHQPPLSLADSNCMTIKINPLTDCQRIS